MRLTRRARGTDIRTGLSPCRILESGEGIVGGFKVAALCGFIWSRLNARGVYPIRFAFRGAIVRDVKDGNHLWVQFGRGANVVSANAICTIYLSLTSTGLDYMVLCIYSLLLNPATPFVYTTLKLSNNFSLPNVRLNSLNRALEPCSCSDFLSLYLQPIVSSAKIQKARKGNHTSRAG